MKNINNSKENSISQKKILFIGLDNGGKTSIIQSLKGKKNLPSFKSISPTKGRSIEDFRAFDSKFNIWDLGGQEAYREKYLKDFEENISRCNKVIYVIDVQDTKRYDLALDYFEKVINLIKNGDLKNIEISIFLHKSDPDLNENRPDITEEIIKDLKDKIKAIIDDKGLFYQIFKTSIYAIFEKIIVDQKSIDGKTIQKIVLDEF